MSYEAVLLSFMHYNVLIKRCMKIIFNHTLSKMLLFQSQSVCPSAKKPSMLHLKMTETE